MKEKESKSGIEQEKENEKMIAHICDRCGQICTDERELRIVRKDGYKIDLCPNCESSLAEWLGISAVVHVPVTKPKK